MTQTAINYGKALYEISVPKEEIERAARLLTEEPRLGTCLESPVIPEKQKDAVIDRIFQGNMAHFFKLLCRYGRAGQVMDILKAYLAYYDRQHGILRAKIRYADQITESDRARIQNFMDENFKAGEILVEEVKDENLLGGCLLEAGGMEYDFSYEGRIRQLEKKLTGR